MSKRLFLTWVVAVSVLLGAGVSTQPALAANVSSDSTNIGFGNVEVGKSKQITVKIHNITALDFLVEIAPPVHSTGAGFSLPPLNVTSSATIRAGGDVYTVVQFSPTSGGSSTGVLNIVVKGIIELAITITGTGGADTTPPAMPTGLTAAAGNRQVALNWAANTESDLSYYIIYRSTTSGFTPASADSVGKVDKPLTAFTNTDLGAGAYYFKIVAVDNSGNRSPASAQASASLAPAISLSPTSLSFDTTTVGATSQKALTIRNPGTQNLSVSNIKVAGPDSLNFEASLSIFSFPYSPLVIAPGDSVRIAVNFMPLSAGAKSATLSISHNAAGSPATVALSGVGTGTIPLGGPGIITTFAGSGPGGSNQGGFSGDGRLATIARLNNPSGVAADRSGNVYIVDTWNNRIRRVGPDGVITTFAGTGNWDFSGDGGQATQATLKNPQGVAVDTAGVVYIADSGNDRIRRVGPNGVITTFAGGGGSFGDGGPATQARLSSPQGVAVDTRGNVYIADNQNQRIRRVGPNGVITTFAGGGSDFGVDGIPATRASLNYPNDVAVDARGNVYFTDSGRVRRVGPDGILTTFAGTGNWDFSGDGGQARLASLRDPQGVAVDVRGFVYIADAGNHRIRRVGPDGIITTFAGTGFQEFSGDGGQASQAGLSRPQGVAVNASGVLYIADSENQRVRRVGSTWTDGPFVVLSASSLTFDNTNVGSTSQRRVTIFNVGNQGLTITGVAATGLDPSHFTASPTTATVAAGDTALITVTFAPTSAGLKSASLSIAHNAAGSPATVALGGLGIGTAPAGQGIITTFAGSGPVGQSQGGYSGDGGLAILARLSNPYGVAVDRRGNVYIVDSWNSRVRRVDPNGVITTFAGGRYYSDGSLGDGGPATQANLSNPSGVAVDTAGVVYIADQGNNRIRRVGLDGVITTFAGGGLSFGDGGPATQARLRNPDGVAVDTRGNVYIADYDNQRIRRVGLDGIITTVAGGGSVFGDGIPATQASLGSPLNVDVDKRGNIYIVESSRIRRVGLDGIITTVAGGGGSTSNGIPATQASLGNPRDVAVDDRGFIYIAEASNNRVRRVGLDGIINAFAGTGLRDFSGDGGPAPNAGLEQPYGVAVDAAGVVYIADTYNNRIRRVSSTWTDGPFVVLSTPSLAFGNINVGSTSQRQAIVFNVGNQSLTITGITTAVPDTQFKASPTTATVAAGDSALITVTFAPASVGAKSASLSISHNAVGSPSTVALSGVGTGVVRPGPGIITTFAGSGPSGSNQGGFSGDGGLAILARLSYPNGVAVDRNGNVYIADTYNNRIRRVGPDGIITTFAGVGFGPGGSSSGEGIPATQASLSSVYGVAVDTAGAVYIAETFNNRIRRVAPNGIITTFAGGGSSFGDGGPATQARLSSPYGVAVDTRGNVYIADYSNQRIRRVDPNGIITTFAGGGSSFGEGIPATQANIDYPNDVAVDTRGNVYFTTSGRVRRVDPNGILTTFAGTGNWDFSGDGGPARLATLRDPQGVAVDVRGFVYIADAGNHRIRRVDLNGIITTFSGTGLPEFSGDGGQASLAGLSQPRGVAVDASGGVYIADSENQRIRQVGSPDGPFVSLSTLSLTFDTTSVGSTSQRQVTIFNVGNQSLSVTGITAGGPDSLQFTASPTTATVAAGDSALITVTFAPASAGFKSASLLIAHNAQGSPANVKLNGTGRGFPSFSLSATSLVFDTTRVGRGSQKTFRISNPGNAFLFASFSTPGSSATTALFGTGPATGTARLDRASGVGAGQAVTLTLSATGLSGHTGYSAEALYDFTALGDPQTAASSPFISPGRSVETFTTVPGFNRRAVAGGVILGGSISGNADLITFTFITQPGFTTTSIGIRQLILNRGTVRDTLFASPLAITINPPGGAPGADGSQFSFPPFVSVAPRDSSLVPVSFIPTSAGPKSASLIISHNAPGSPATVALSGVGVLPSIGLSPTSLVFDTTDVGKISQRALRISNPDSSSLPIGIRGAGPDTSQFLFPSFVFIPPFVRDTSVIVSFFPASAGPKSASLTLSLFSPGGAADFATVTLSGTGRAPSDIPGVPTIRTFAGSGPTGPSTGGYSGDGRPAILAVLRTPYGVAVDRKGNVYIADTGNNRVRRVDPNGVITTFAGGGGSSGDGIPATQASLNGVYGVAVDTAGVVYIADTFNNRIRRVGLDGIITTFAGGGGSFGDGGPATQARLSSPYSVAVDSKGPDVYIVDTGNQRIRRVGPDGIITTFAGGGSDSGDGIPATQARLSLSFLPGIAVDPRQGDVYFTDSGRIRRVRRSDGVITAFAGTGSFSFSGDGGPAIQASLRTPQGIVVDVRGFVYISDTENYRVRVVGPDGIITTFAGTGILDYSVSGDGGPADKAGLSRLRGLTVDIVGNVYIADTENNRIRRVSAPTSLPKPSGISGRVRYAKLTLEPGDPVDSVRVTIAGIGDSIRVALTDTSGSFQFAATFITFSLTASKQGGLNNAVQGADALLVMQRTSFLAPAGPKGDLSADVNSDGTSNNADALAILRYLAFFNSGIGQVGQWRFVSGAEKGDFTAFLVGDVDHSWRRAIGAPAAKTVVSPVVVSLKEADGKAGEEVHVPILVQSGSEAVSTFLASLSYDPALLEYRSASATGASQGYLLVVNGETEGEIHLAAASAQGVPVDGAFVDLVFRVRQGDPSSKSARPRDRRSDLSLLRVVVNDLSVSDISAGAISVRDVPEKFTLSQNYPNPFNPVSQINFGLPEDTRVRLVIYNLLGQQVRVLVDERREAGYHSVTWDGRADGGRPVGSGVYFYRLEAPGFAETKRMVLVK